ncbi:MAG: 23S rRNA (uracil(1939)-C(5))-methyltransferase RlmD [Verrucomicrobiota bacterium]
MQEIELTTEKMAFEGRAIARQNRFVIFVEGALPGEKVLAEVTQRKRNHAFARVTRVLEAAPYREQPPCAAYGECGGCSFQQASYSAQLQIKRDVLLESLYGVPGVPELVLEIIGADSPFRFRNKMVFAFGTSEGQTVLGLHRRREWHSVILTDMCMLQSKESNEIIKRTLAFVKAYSLPVFDDVKNEGLLRNLVIREGKNTGQRMVHLHAAGPHPAFEQLPVALDGLCDTFVVSYHRNVPEDAPPEHTHVLKGKGFIEERLNDFTFEIGPSTFFQTNTKQAEKLFRVLADWAGKVRPKNAVDLYAGTGPIAIHLGAVAEKVVGIESNADSVKMAQRNIERNQIKNVEMMCVEVEKAGIRAFPTPTDLIVVDPPRAGLHKKAVELLLCVGAPNLFYVSCNPATLARDLKLLVAGGYGVDAIQPLDMFPHTFHIEAIVRLSAHDRLATA